MKTVLVTGAGGFLGSTLVDDLLDGGYHVRALVRAGSPLSNSRTSDVTVGDVRDPISVKTASADCDCVIHLAGKAHAIDDDHLNEDEYQSVNVGGTRQLLDAAVAAGNKKFVFVSSVKVFGEETTGCLDETTAAAPQTPYARSKWMAEQLVASYAKSGSLTTVSFRLPLVYGPTHKGNLYRMLRAIDRGWFPPLPHVSTVRSMLHVKNFVLAIRAALDAKIFVKPVYIVTDSTPYSVTEVYELLRSGLGKRPPRWRVPRWALSLGACCGDVVQSITGKQLPFSSSILEKLLGQAWYSPEAAIQDLGYQPTYTFEAAIPELIEHYRGSLSQCGF